MSVEINSAPGLLCDSYPLPLRVDDSGVIRVGRTRIPIETVYRAYMRGESAESIIESYPTLDIADVYSVISHCIRRRDQVERYLREVEVREEESREMIESRFDHTGLRERLLARLTSIQS